MRLLVAGRHAKAVARAAGAFADDLTIETAETKGAAIALLQRAQFDLILACEKLSDCSGLEVLGHVVVNAPDTLRIFAAPPSTLNFLKGKLGRFGLFRTLSYPINFRQVWSAIDLVRSCVQSEVSPQARKQMPRVRHVVLDSAWKAGTPRRTVSKPDTAVVGACPNPAIDASPGPRPPTRIPESAAFKRALARRNEAKRRIASATDESLAQLAQLVTTTRRQTLDSRASPWRRKRTALLAGSAVFAAGTAALLSFFMLSSNNSIGPSALPLVASSDRPPSRKVLPWQAPTPQPTPTTVVPSETLPPATADLDAEAKAGLAPFGKQPGYSEPPPPTPPAATSEPPSYDESSPPIEQ